MTITKSSRVSRRCTALLLSILLAACGGGGSSSGNAGSTGSASETPPTTTPTSTGNVLFAPNLGNGIVGAFPTLTLTQGTAQGVQLTLSGMTGINVQYDKAHDWLYAVIANGQQNEVAVYAQASTASGRLTPARTFQLPAKIVLVTKIVLDPVADKLYVAGEVQSDGSLLLVYANASTATGTPTPVQQFAAVSGLSDFTVDAGRGLVYYSSNAPSMLHRLTLASGTDQSIACNYCTPDGTAVDSARDRLYVVDLFKSVHVITGASTAQPTDIASMYVIDATYLTYDSHNDRLYVSAGSQVGIYDDVQSVTATLGAALTMVTANGLQSAGEFGLPL